MKRKCCSKPDHEHCLNCGKKFTDGVNGYCLKCYGAVTEDRPLKGRKRCIVMNCENYSDMGAFINGLCGPCYLYVVEGHSLYSQLHRNGLNAFATNTAAIIKNLLVQLNDPTRTGVRQSALISDEELRKLRHG